MDSEHYCAECGDLRDAPGVCSACVVFELVDLTEHEARTLEG